MKFTPRQPTPPPAGRATPTRFLRLQPAEDAPALSNSGKFEPRPVPALGEVSVRAATPSQRVRLHLDPHVASQPLPAASPVDEFQELESAAIHAPEDAATDAATEPVAPEYESQPAWLESEAITPADDLPASETATEDVPLDETQASEPGDTAPSSFFELPPDARTIQKVWFPPPPASSTVPLWKPATSALAMPPPPVTRPSGRGNARPSLDLKTRRRDTAPVSLEPVTRPITRPDLRRSSPSLSHLTHPQPALGAGFWVFLMLLLLAFVSVLGYFILVPMIAAHQARTAAAAAAPGLQIPRAVSFVTAVRNNPVVELPVSGAVEPSRETAIYARTTGYVRDWLVDLGDKVKAGEVLAELDTPEIDHQLVEARAASDQAKASLALAQNEVDRWTAMVGNHAVSQQDTDAKIAARNEAQANFNAAEANVARLVDLEMFKEIRAPYAGTITARNLEVGTLVGAGPGPAGSELFHLIETDPVRIFVNVPEASAPSIHSGVPAKLEATAYPGRVFTGQVVRDAGALDPQSHALRTEIHVANPDGALMPGTLAEVHLLLFDNRPALLIPSDTLVVNADGASVVRIVPGDGREIARITAVKLGRSFGSVVEVLSNLRDGDRLVAHPPPDLKDGMIVDARPLGNDPMPSLLPPHPSAPRA